MHRQSPKAYSDEATFQVSKHLSTYTMSRTVSIAKPFSRNVARTVKDFYSLGKVEERRSEAGLCAASSRLLLVTVHMYVRNREASNASVSSSFSMPIFDFFPRRWQPSYLLPLARRYDKRVRAVVGAYCRPRCSFASKRIRRTNGTTSGIYTYASLLLCHETNALSANHRGAVHKDDDHDDAVEDDSSQLSILEDHGSTTRSRLAGSELGVSCECLDSIERIERIERVERMDKKPKRTCQQELYSLLLGV